MSLPNEIATKKIVTAGLCLLAMALPSLAHADPACAVVQAVRDASVHDFKPILTESGSADTYEVTVSLPAADSCKLDRALEKDFGELRYRCEFRSLNFAAAGAATLAENVDKVGLKYTGLLAACLSGLVRKESETTWGKTTTFVDDKGQRWFDVTRQGSFFTVEAFTASKNPNY